MNIFAELRKGTETHSPAETRELASALARKLPPNQTLALHGDLGVGKTTFTSGLACGLGIKEPVTSPTFTLYSIYHGPHGSLIHLDAYRLSENDPLEELLPEEYFTTPWLLVVEWPDHVPDWLPEPTHHLYLSIRSQNTHFLKGEFQRL